MRGYDEALLCFRGSRAKLNFLEDACLYPASTAAGASPPAFVYRRHCAVNFANWLRRRRCSGADYLRYQIDAYARGRWQSSTLLRFYAAAAGGMSNLYGSRFGPCLKCRVHERGMLEEGR
jgi:hypothetical protein